ncbi:TauD/TfdA family dioxygenase [Kineosporia sp. J2-2]|uniref:TauD/TfdA family dioxygenase n=1 Tax=Kineosporia corallincola TaxID=2835133 RepID=A0ABS5TPG5_9ACTN|nr:TauD/TfdA family dioxygenase [Kineosporia corallincola]MBT0772977.1 TauD/TfdA family dioxygenase [Kineosporia corallincola]
MSEGTRVTLCTPTVPGLDARDWLTGPGPGPAGLRDTNGAVLLRGFRPLDSEGLSALASAMSGELLDYTNRSTPRTRVSGRVFTSTEYPADQTIPMHNEMSYADSWPDTLFFASVVPAAEGGETPLADSSRVYDRIPAETRGRFERDGVMYVRNFGSGLDLSWQEAFQTQDRSELEAYCKEHGIQTEWMDDDRLRTRHVVQASVISHRTGRKVWFNQAHLFHVSSLPSHVEHELRESFSEDELPRNALYGDGTPLAADDLGAIRSAYAAEEVATRWQAGDVMIVDNEQFAHGRRPYAGARSLLVAMT